MNLSFLKNIQREHSNEIATERMNHYCILKHDLRDNCDVMCKNRTIKMCSMMSSFWGDIFAKEQYR